MEVELLNDVSDDDNSDDNQFVASCKMLKCVCRN